MPKDAFQGPANFIFNPTLEKQEIINIQKSYSNKFMLVYYGALFLYVLIILAMILVPLFIYTRYGREQKINYQGIFEREPVPNTKPYIINSLCVGKIGDTTYDAITATLLDLVRRQHILLQSTEKGIFLRKKEKDIRLTFCKRPGEFLTAPEQRVYDFHQSFSVGNILSWSGFIKDLNKQENAIKYMQFVKRFEKSVDESYEIKQFFDFTGSRMFRFFSGLLLFIFFALFYISLVPHANYPILSTGMLIAFSCLFFAVIGLSLPAKVFGRFTNDGLFLYRKSLNFKKFISDMTLLKRYPPASIAIWEEQLVYATAFGIADAVIDNMRVAVKEEMITMSPLYPVYQSRYIRTFTNVHYVASLSMVKTTGGGGSYGGFRGGGGIGGGFGGGGGGAR